MSFGGIHNHWYVLGSRNYYYYFLFFSSGASGALLLRSSVSCCWKCLDSTKPTWILLIHPFPQSSLTTFVNSLWLSPAFLLGLTCNSTANFWTDLIQVLYVHDLIKIRQYACIATLAGTLFGPPACCSFEDATVAAPTRSELR